jgi:hypothetical protein
VSISWLRKAAGALVIEGVLIPVFARKGADCAARRAIWETRSVPKTRVAGEGDVLVRDRDCERDADADADRDADADADRDLEGVRVPCRESARDREPARDEGGSLTDISRKARA